MKKNLDILIFNTVGNTGAFSFIEHIGKFARHSRHNCFYHNFAYQFDPAMDFKPFDVLVFTHNFWLPSLSDAQREAVRNANALKVMFLQDEFQYVREMNGVMAEMGVELMFSCVAKRDFDTFYPKAHIPSLREVHQTLTGFVTAGLESPELRAHGRRTWDVGYRGRPPVFYMGNLGQHKRWIAEEMEPCIRNAGLKCNISYHEDDRLGGRDWIDFLRATRVQLGSPSGTSIVDMDGSLIEGVEACRAANPHVPYEEVHAAVLAEHEGRLGIDTISPRNFEYAATGAAMAMIEGDYGGHLTAGEHYIPIAPDYSNKEQVVEIIKDREACEAVADRAYGHLIASGAFRASTFVEKFDDLIERHAERNEEKPNVDRAEFEAKLAERFGQVLFFRRDGAKLVDGPAGATLRARQRLGSRLASLPIIGQALRKSGGDPVLKWSKARAALDLVRTHREFQKLFFEYGRSPEVRDQYSLSIAEMLKTFLLLGLVKSAHWGAEPFGEGFFVTLERTGNTLTLLGHPAGVAKPQGFPPVGAAHARDALHFGAIRKVQLDLSSVWPTQKFATGTLFSWPIRGEAALFRSAPDAYFPLKAISAFAGSEPDTVLDALLTPFKAPSPAQRAALSSTFDLKI